MKTLRIRIVTVAKIELITPTPMSWSTPAASPILLGRSSASVLQLAGEVVLVVEVVEGLVVVDEVGDVLGVLGNVLGEVLDLADQRRDQQRPEPDRDHDQGQVGERDREAALHVAGEQVDRARHRDGDERRDHQPGERLLQAGRSGRARGRPRPRSGPFAARPAARVPRCHHRHHRPTPSAGRSVPRPDRARLPTRRSARLGPWRSAPVATMKAVIARTRASSARGIKPVAGIGALGPGERVTALPGAQRLRAHADAAAELADPEPSAASASTGVSALVAKM